MINNTLWEINDVKYFNCNWFIPEIIAFISCEVVGIDRNINLNNFLLIIYILLTACLIRLLWNIILLMHGLGHSLLGTIVDQDLSFLCLSNILENKKINILFISCLPFSKIFIPTFSEADSLWLKVGKKEPWKVRLKGLGGLLLNAIFGVISLSYWLTNISLSYNNYSWNSLLLFQSIAIFSGLNFLLLISSLTDWRSVITGQAERLYCGNFGFVGIRKSSDQEILPSSVISLFYVMGRETEIRGEQAGGAMTLCLEPSGQTVFVGHKKVNSKRGNLTKSLEKSFHRIREKAVRQGIKPVPEAVIAAWHYRFGTSGPPSVSETHWHEWSAAQKRGIWQIDKGEWIQTTKNVNHRITHNGDFDGWKCFNNKSIEQKTLGLWLERVLQTPNHTIGDSPKIAGMMDLLITQGDWFASLRLAYQVVFAPDIEAAFAGYPPEKKAPNTAPSSVDLNYWTDIVDSVFFNYITMLPTAQSLWNKTERNQFQVLIVQCLQKINPFNQYQPEKLMIFAEVTVEAFLHNDVYQATQQFMARAKGSFGLVVVSTLMTNRVVLSALGQPMIIGVDPLSEHSVYASEAFAVDAVLHNSSESYRLDLDQNAGEIAVLSTTNVRIYSMTHKRELDETEIRHRQVPLIAHPYIDRGKETKSNDPIEQDLQEIPNILRKIEDDWINPSSLNRQTAEYFLNLLITKAKYVEDKQNKLTSIGLDSSLAQSQHLDILITGIENSLWLGEEFAKNLKMIFPLLSISTLSANKVLDKLQYDLDSLHLAGQSIVFVISQSGQSFPSRQVMYACDLLVRQKVIREFFILTGEPSSFIGSPLSRTIFPDELFSRRIFINNAGRRTCEPATVTVAATHHTLTKLLLYLARKMQLAFPEKQPLGMNLSLDNLSYLEKISTETLYQDIPEILGVTTTGQRQKTRLHRQIIKEGRKWALHILETPIAWFIQALYILITVGWVIPFGYMIPLVQTVFKDIFWAFQIPVDTAIVTFLMPELILADIMIYIFGPWFWILGLRWLQRRSLLARIGKRTLVIGDVYLVHALLESYVSKLFSLSYGITSLEIHGANPQDHFLHEFSHRVVRGCLLFLGVPDGLCSQRMQNKENSVLMTAKQASGIQNLNTGPEVLLIGSNLAITKQGFENTIILPSWNDNMSEEYPEKSTLTNRIVEDLRESRFGAFKRLLASYVFFWALAKRVATFPIVHYAFWKSQSRTKIMTTAAPVSAAYLDRPEFEEISLLDLPSIANREQS